MGPGPGHVRGAPQAGDGAGQRERGRRGQGGEEGWCPGVPWELGGGGGGVQAQEGTQASTAVQKLTARERRGDEEQ